MREFGGLRARVDVAPSTRCCRRDRRRRRGGGRAAPRAARHRPVVLRADAPLHPRKNLYAAPQIAAAPPPPRPPRPPPPRPPPTLPSAAIDQETALPLRTSPTTARCSAPRGGTNFLLGRCARQLLRAGARGEACTAPSSRSAAWTCSRSTPRWPSTTRASPSYDRRAPGRARADERLERTKASASRARSAARHAAASIVRWARGEERRADVFEEADEMRRRPLRRRRRREPGRVDAGPAPGKAGAADADDEDNASDEEQPVERGRPGRTRRGSRARALASSRARGAQH